jgi:uncharacterized damage-inducible protein DinB
MKVSMPDPGRLNDYYRSYLDEFRAADLLEACASQQKTTRQFLGAVPAEKEKHRYAPGKWSVREVAGHLCDTERILAYRALRFGRGDAAPLPGFDENSYTAKAGYDAVALPEITAQLSLIREANLYLFRSFSAGDYDREGLANDTRVTVRDILYFILAHQAHHLRIIKERYL